MITTQQIRAGRALLGWPQHRLAEQASLSLPTIKRAEAGDGVPVSAEAKSAIRAALEAGGVEFLDGISPGVCLRVVEVYANPNSEGIWGVLARWEVGAPVQWVAPTVAENAAAEAERRGDPRLPGMLRKAAKQARRYNSDKFGS